MSTPRASMDFFQSQDAARRKTTLLILFFFLAVLCIIIGVYGAVILAWSLSGESMPDPWEPSLFGGVALGVVAIVLIGSLYKTIVLSKGGEAVAQMLGATPVDPNTKDPDERKLVNVVEEMAIASGLPVPRIYALQAEKGINAFAAGLTPQTAVVAVTRGCLTTLTRDELQGVVGHEFSHILNGDMRINLRLMGLIHGILVIGLIGWAILRGLSSRDSQSTSDRKGGGGIPVLVLGLLLTAVGYIGVFFGKVIKSAVSRQREFLADAAALQFTRNPSGLLGALRKILSSKAGSQVGNRRAEEASHLFFANGLGAAFLRLLSTHPPLEERIRRIEPLFQKGLAEGGAGLNARAQEVPEKSPVSFVAAPGEEESRGLRVSPEALVASVGSPRPVHLAYAAKVISDLPPLVSEEVHEPFGARALLYGLLLSREEKVREAQLQLLERSGDPAVLRRLRMLLPVVEGLGPGYRLPLVDMALPTLKTLSLRQYEVFRQNLTRLAEADRKITLFEYALQRTVGRHLDSFFTEKKPPLPRYHDFDQVQVECTEILSALAWHGTEDAPVAAGAFREAIKQMGVSRTFSLLPREKCTLHGLDRALGRLSRASPRLKSRILSACTSCVSTDGRITVTEAELLRAVADSLDCPVPPILPGTLERHPVIRNPTSA